jgi:ABC-type uncharacterized transport system substrate-binding protein
VPLLLAICSSAEGQQVGKIPRAGVIAPEAPDPYGPNLPDHFHRTGILLDKVIRGAKPADLPVEQPTKFEFIINLKAAKQIGVTIPPNVLARADKVIR